MDDILSHELSETPLSLADSTGHLHPATSKADLGHLLTADVSTGSISEPISQAVVTIIDGQALVQSIGKPDGAKTFGDLADVFCHAICCKQGKRINVVFDRYNVISIKAETRAKRVGKAPKRSIRLVIDGRDVPLPVNWSQFINLPDNNANLAEFLSDSLMDFGQTLTDREIVTAGGFNELLETRSSIGRGLEMLKADHEEADNRIVLHALEACEEGYERIIVFCRDTDVLVWMSAGTSKAPKFIKIVLPVKMRTNLPAFHAVTGCDAVSQFSGYGKTLTWRAYQKHFALLQGLGIDELSEETISSIEAFVCRLYSPKSNIKSVNELRCYMFQKGNCDVEKLPPTHDALLHHIHRAHYQCKIWRLASQPIQTLQPPTENGWKMDAESNTLKPVLTNMRPIPVNCTEITKCGCTNCSTTRCSCRKKELQCTAACSCTDFQCENPFKPK